MNPSMPKMSLTITAIIPFALGACSAAKQEPFVPATMLKASLDATQHAQVLHTTTEIDSGPDTAMRDEWHNWAAEGRGYRSELPGLIEVYNEPQRKHYRFEKDTHQIGVIENKETSLTHEFIRRASQEENVEYVIARACTGAATFHDEQIAVDGRVIHRATCQDDTNHPRVIDYDPVAKQILRTESWIQGGTRVVTSYEYLDPSQLDPALFELKAPPDATVKIAPPDQAAMSQCMTNLRDLMGVFMDYEDKHPEGLPSDLDQAIRSSRFYRPSMLFCPLVPASDRLQYQCLVPAPVTSIVNQNYKTVVFQCDRHSGYVIQAFADGHCESKRTK